MSKIDPAFSRIDQRRSGVYIWKVENFQLVPVPKDCYGVFFRGDSYVILSINEKKWSAIDTHVHFWLGTETTQDEAGVAAYKTVELDDFLAGAPVQHREVEGMESRRFLSLFPHGIRIKAGGVKSGFSHVERGVFQPRLVHVKGKRCPRFSEMIGIDWSLMNHGDCFILDLGNVIIPWFGHSCNRMEKMKALDYCRKLRDERGAKANIVFVEDGQEEQMDTDVKSVFEQFLPLKEKNKVLSSEAGGKDEGEERQAVENMKLFSCQEEGGTLTIQEIKTGPLYKQDLSTNDTYIIDNGLAGIWAWIGRKSSQEERHEAMRNAMGFLKKKNYPSHTMVTRVVEGAESSDFKCLFKEWPQPVTLGKVYAQGRIAKTVQTKFDAKTLHSNQSLAAETQMVDDGTGDVEVWRVENFELKPVDNNCYGEFFGGDCYVVLYTYEVNGRESHIIYYWLGAKSGHDERGTAALKAVELDDKMGGKPVQVRVVQYKEPSHFIALFGGRIVIFQGGKAGWNPGERSVYGPGDRYMLHVRGTSRLDTKAVQVDLLASSLNSNDVFVIFTKTNVYIWAGKSCTGDEREMAKSVAERSPRTPILVFEGHEKDDFWSILGGKAEYASEKHMHDTGCHPPRLFEISNASGVMKADYVHNFVQADLIPEDVMLLDCWVCIYIWIGQNCNVAERKEAPVMAQQYLQTDPSGRDPNTVLLQIKQGFEPPSFTGFFGVWDRELWSKGKSYEEVRMELCDGNMPILQVQLNTANGPQDYGEMPKYSYHELTVDMASLPPGVDPSAREVHLKDVDFKRIFNVNYADFNILPAWKQKQMKKGARLF